MCVFFRFVAFCLLYYYWPKNCTVNVTLLSAKIGQVFFLFICYFFYSSLETKQNRQLQDPMSRPTANVCAGPPACPF